VETIGLQAKARSQEGTIEHYWFENEDVCLARTPFHRIRIPFEPFDSGLDYVPQPERTELIVEWIKAAWRIWLTTQQPTRRRRRATERPNRQAAWKADGFRANPNVSNVC
jgi:hypothetical protein